MPVGAWDAIYIIDGLLANASGVKPDTIHATRRARASPFTLAQLFGFALIPRIRNWKDLIFFRHSADTGHEHLEALFGEGDRGRAPARPARFPKPRSDRTLIIAII